MRRAAILLILPMLLLVASCGDDASTTETGGDPTTTTTTTTTTAPASGRSDGVAIRISVGGGYSPQGLDFAATPTVVLQDGTVMTAGAMTMQYPGPAVGPVSTGHLTAAAVHDLVAAAKAAHLDQVVDYGMPGVTDMPTTTIEVEIDGRGHVASVYALGVEEDADARMGMTDEQIAARRDASGFVARVLGVVSSAAHDTYVPTAYQVEAYEADPLDPSAEPPLPNELDWPLASPLVANRCTDVTGTDAQSLSRALEQATAITRWHSDGRVFTLAVKSVLPGTPPCPTA